MESASRNFRKTQEQDTVSIVRAGDYTPQGMIDKAVERAIRLCGAEDLVRPGSSVLVKPNALLPARPERAITTHPAVISAVCRFLSKRKCRITIGDSSSHSGQGMRAMRRAGFESVAKKWDARLVDLDRGGIVHVKTPNRSGKLPRVGISRIAKDSDYVITIPKLKTHMLATMTCAVKICYGLVLGRQKCSIHADNPDAIQFSKALIDIFEAKTPDLTIVDGIVGMDGLGPSQGRKRHFGIIAAGKNSPAVDLAMARITGIGERHVPTIVECIERGILDPQRLILVGDEPPKGRRFRKPFMTWRGFSTLRDVFGVHAFTVFQELVSPKPVIIPSKCKKCGACVRICPQKVLEFPENGAPPIFARRDECILCYCCHETCPHEAIKLSRILVPAP